MKLVYAKLEEKQPEKFLQGVDSAGKIDFARSLADAERLRYLAVRVSLEYPQEQDFLLLDRKILKLGPDARDIPRIRRLLLHILSAIDRNCFLEHYRLLVRAQMIDHRIARDLVEPR